MKKFHGRSNLFKGLGFMFVFILLVLQVAAGPAQPDWSMSGQNITNLRNQPFETKLNTTNVNSLISKWVFTTHGDVSATPAVSGNAVYFPDWGGFLYKLNAKTGAVIWQVDLSALTGVPGTVSRTTPTLYNGFLLVGTQLGAYMMALDKETGALLWTTQLDTHQYAIITQSPVVYKGVAYVGVSSSEEAAAAFVPGYICCTFRGSMAALNIETGAILWRTWTTLDNGGAPGGYSGAAVWGSTAVVDSKRGSVYITTGNNYDVPQQVKDCFAADPHAICDDPQNYVDAILSLDLNTGAIKWVTKLEAYDAWNVACLIGGINCPTPAGPDYDFGQGAMLIRARGKPDILAAGQKSGVMWGFNPENGVVLWATRGGPGGTLGGMEWGSATDGTRIYYSIANNGHEPYTLLNSETVTGGLWGAIDPYTGELLWQTADPTGAIDTGAVSVANGVVYAGSMEPNPALPTFFAFDAATGQILWSYVSGGSVNSGASIVNGNVFWGSGYARVGGGSSNNLFYAFGLP